MMPNLSEQVAALEAELDALKVERDELQRMFRNRDGRLREAEQKLEAKGKALETHGAEIRRLDALLAESESRVSGAAREGARTMADAMRDKVSKGLAGYAFHNLVVEAMEGIRDEVLAFYPAVPAEGERTRTDAWVACPKCGEALPCEYHCRPAPTPARKPERVKFGSREVWYDASNTEFPYRIGFAGSHGCGGESTLAGVLRYFACNGIFGTQDEYAALLSLRDGGE